MGLGLCMLMASCAFVASGIISVKAVPMIEIELEVGGNLSGGGFEAVADGGGSGSGKADGPRGYQTSERYLFLEPTPGHFMVRLHDKVYVDSTRHTTVVDRTIPVLPKSITQQEKGWVTIGPGIRIVAYMKP